MAVTGVSTIKSLSALGCYGTQKIRAANVEAILCACCVPCRSMRLEDDEGASGDKGRRCKGKSGL